LAADAHSLHNVPMADALRKIQSGLEGQSRPLREFGVFLNAAEVQAEAFRLGYGKTKAEISEGEKVMARASLITKGLADAHGDLERTFGQTKNQMEAFWGSLSNLGQEIGKILIPAFDMIVQGAVGMIGRMQSGFQENKATFVGWVAAIMEGLNMTGTTWRNFGDIWTITTLEIAKEMLNLMGVIQSALAGTGTFFMTSWTDIAGAIITSATTMASYLLLPGEYLVIGMTKGIEIVGSIWDAFVGVFTTGMDYLLRPLRDMYNAITGETMSVEEDFGRLKGLFDAPAKGGKALSDMIGGLREGLIGMGQEGKAGIDAWSQSGATAMAKWGESAKSGATDSMAVIDDQIKAAQDRMQGRETAAAETGKPKTELQLLAESATRSSKMGMEGEDETTVDKFKAEIMGAAEFASKLRLAQAGEDVPQKQLTELQQIREQDKINGDMLAKIADQTFGAILA
jgi:hypothetical protein